MKLHFFLNRGRSARLPVDAGIVGAAKSTSVFEFVKKMMVRMDMAKKAAFECAQEKKQCVKQRHITGAGRKQKSRLEIKYI